MRLSPERALELQSDEVLIRALSEPFLYRWAFDVGLIGRSLNDRVEGNGYTERDFIEVPLQQCSNAAMQGCKRFQHEFFDMVTANFELLLIKRALRTWARRVKKFDQSEWQFLLRGG